MHSMEFMLSMTENILQPFKNHLGTNESSVLKNDSYSVQNLNKYK